MGTNPALTPLFLPLNSDFFSFFHSWTLKKKSWMTRTNRNEHFRDQKRFSCTVYGAIGHALDGKVAWMITKRTTNTAGYCNFLRHCKSHLRADLQNTKPVWLHDGHPAHTSRIGKALCARLFTPMLNVAYSSEMNS